MPVNTRIHDGTQVTIRPIKAPDASLLFDMHGRASSHSLFYRYLAPYKPSREDIARICEIEETEGVALVATVHTPAEEIIGMAYYVLGEGEDVVTAEFAILIEDRYQGVGLGSTLFWELCQSAMERGVNVFKGDIHPANQKMLGVIRSSGYPVESRFTYGSLELRISLQTEPAYAFALG